MPSLLFPLEMLLLKTDILKTYLVKKILHFTFVQYSSIMKIFSFSHVLSGLLQLDIFWSFTIWISWCFKGFLMILVVLCSFNRSLLFFGRAKWCSALWQQLRCRVSCVSYWFSVLTAPLASIICTSHSPTPIRSSFKTLHKFHFTLTLRIAWISVDSHLFHTLICSDYFSIPGHI
jgi:hypothetical protein